MTSCPRLLHTREICKISDNLADTNPQKDNCKC